MELSPIERWILSNQLEILEALYPDNAKSFAVQRKAIECGYMAAIDLPFNANTMADADSNEVWNTLQMFDDINNSIRELETDVFENHRRRKFCGYDGNDEAEFMAFASYTVKCLKRWEDLPLRNPDFNSHRQMRPIYRNMLATWNGFTQEGHSRLMNQEQVQAVLDSGNC